MSRISQFLNQYEHQYSYCSVNIAWDGSQERQKFCFYKFEFTNQQFQTQHTLSHDYGNLMLFRMMLSFNEAQKLLLNISKGKLTYYKIYGNGKQRIQTIAKIDIGSGSFERVSLNSDSQDGIIRSIWPTQYYTYLLQSPPFSRIRQSYITMFLIYNTCISISTLLCLDFAIGNLF
jgi:hypothetical protein